MSPEHALFQVMEPVDTVSSIHLDKAFLCQDEDNVIQIVKNYMKNTTTYVNSLISDCIIKRRRSSGEVREELKSRTIGNSSSMYRISH
jgi:hypothetical protein